MINKGEFGGSEMEQSEALKQSQLGKEKKHQGSWESLTARGRQRPCIVVESFGQELTFYISTHRDMKTTMRQVHSFQGRPPT